ncbi:MAG: glycosyltransferase family 39 protein [Elusimicrobiota bacterium]|jgi:hypothetical protein
MTPTSLTASIFLLRILVPLHFLSANLGFTQIFGDDPPKILESLFWTRQPCFWPSEQVLPMGFWVLGSGLAIFKNIVAAHLLLNTILSLGVMAAAAALTRRIFPEDGSAPMFAALFAGLHPVFLVHGMSALLEFPLLNLFTLCGCIFFLRARDAGESRDLLFAALCFAAASMTRYDGWFPCVIFSIILLRDMLRLRRAARRVPWAFPSSLLIVWAHSFAWLAYKWRGPLQLLSSEHALRSVKPPDWNSLPGYAAEMLSRPFQDLFMRFSVILAFCAVGLAYSLRKRLPVRKDFLAFPVGQALCLAPFYALGFLNPFCHCSHFAPAAALLTPLAGRGASAAVEAFPFPKIGRVLLAAALSSLFLWRFPAMVRSSNNYTPDMIRLASLLRDLDARDSLRASSAALIELQPSENASFGRIWEPQLLLLLHPNPSPPQDLPTANASDPIFFDRGWSPVRKEDDIVFDDKANPSILSRPPAELSAFLRKNQIKIAAVLSPLSARRLEAWMQPAAAFGRYRILTSKDLPELRQAVERAAPALLHGRGLMLYREFEFLSRAGDP